MSTLFGMVKIADVLDWVERRDVRPLVFAVTGSHAWGLSRPDSDLDIRGIYLDSTEKVLSLHPGDDNIESQHELGGVVDFQLYELKKALNMLLRHNGNIVEMLLSPTVFFLDGVDWVSIGRKFLTKRNVCEEVIKDYEMTSA